MILGVGVDLVAIDRVARLWGRYGARLAARLLSPAEQAELRAHPAFTDPARRDPFAARLLAKRFAAKEAFAKAWGSGIGAALSFHDLTVAHRASGEPYWVFSGRFAAAWQQRGAERAHLSLSDEVAHVVAFVVIEGRADAA